MLTKSLVIICGVFLACLYFRWKRNKFLFKIKDIPYGVKHYPLIGPVHLLIGKSPDDLFKTGINLFSEAPSSFSKFIVFFKLIMVVKNPDDIRKILSSPHCLDKGSPYSIIPLGNGLLTAKSAIWKFHRKLLNPAFHIALLNKTFIHQFNETAQHLVTDLQCKIGMNTFDIEPIIASRLTNLQLKTLFGKDVGDEETRIVHENNKRLSECISTKMMNSYTQFVIIFFEKLLKLQPLVDRIMNNNYKYLEPMIEDARSNYQQKLEIGEPQEDSKNKPEIFIRKLISLEKMGYFKNEDLKDHINTILLVGTDTLTVTISNCMLCLAMNQDAQEKCANEIKETIGDQFDTIDKSDLIKLELLDRTINECIRLISPVPVIARTCFTDVILDDQKLIPAGTDILIPIQVIHHSKELWGDNPTKFNADNFLPENVAKRPLLSFMPFSYGMRNCIAKKYSQYAVKVIMAHLLVNYKFSTELKLDDLNMGYGVTIIIRNKHLVRIEKR